MKKCVVSEKCGGCTYQGMAYERQLAKKEEEVRKLFAGLGTPEKIVGSDSEYRYRNKAQISFEEGRDGSIRMGNYAVSTHRIIPVKDCQLLPELTNSIFLTVKELAEKLHIPVFDEKKMQGVLRHVQVRTNHDHTKALVTLVTGTETFPKKKTFIHLLREAHPGIVSIVQNINSRYTSMILGRKNIVLYGNGYLEDTLLGHTFRLSSGSFYQINHAQTEKLYRKAMELADVKKTDTVLDAYCGIGTIGICMADKAGKIIGVEINREAVRDAAENAKRNGFENTEYTAEDAGIWMRKAAGEKRRIDTVIMDPPRAGADEAFLSSLVKLSPSRVVYISCDPRTQVRDIRYLKKYGYQLRSIHPFDLFPFTPHIEAIALLEHADSRKEMKAYE